MRFPLPFAVFAFAVFVLVFAIGIAPATLAQSSNTQADAQKELDALLGNAPEKDPETLPYLTKAFEEECLRTEHPVIGGKDLEQLCACSTRNLIKEMTAEDILAMRKNNEEGLFQRGRLFMFVYEPCISSSLARQVGNQCMGSARGKYMLHNQSAVCACLGERIAGDFKEVIPRRIQGMVERNAVIDDPLGFLVNEKMFNRQMRFHTKNCVWAFETLPSRSRSR